MFVVVSGGSGSGKSQFSEDLLLCLDARDKKNCEGKTPKEGGQAENRIYIATMFPFDEESHARIKRHRIMRRDKGFFTVECYTGLKNLVLPERNGQKPSVLLECMSNLAANEFYMESGAGARTTEEILSGIQSLAAQAAHLIVVTNEVFSDGTLYDPSTEAYKKILGEINCGMAAQADAFVEVVYSIPLWHKGEPI